MFSLHSMQNSFLYCFCFFFVFLFQKKGFEYILRENADIVCLQEVICPKDKLPQEVKDLTGYHQYWEEGEYVGSGYIEKQTYGQ